MTERTERDEMVDQAIELLIDENVGGFAVVGIGEEGVHTVTMTDRQDELLAVWALADQVLENARAQDIPLTPPDVIRLAAEAAADQGLIPEEEL
jgi:hypothetical protein